MAEFRHFENPHNIIFLPIWMKFGRLVQNDMVKTETGSRIPILQTFVFRHWK